MLSACGGDAPSKDFFATEQARVKPRTTMPCVDYKPLKNPYFGDLHVHTAISNDGFSFGARTRPDDAYRYAFAKGSVKLAINQGDQENLREVSIDRPLDFMAVTDHPEFLGEQTLCMDRANPASNADFCSAFADGQGRNPALLAKIFSPFPTRNEQL